MKKLLTIAAAFLFAAALCAGCAEAAEPVAHMTAAGPGVTAVRGGKAAELAKGAPVFQNDIIRTGAKAKAEIKFNDGTTIAMGPASEVKASEFVMSGARSSFAADVAKGAARVVTGSIVKQNPTGFKINTPRSTVGIRGTTVTFFCNKGEILAIDSMGPESYLTITDRDSANQIRVSSVNEIVVTPQEAPTRVIPRTAEITRTLGDAFESGSQAARNELLKTIEPTAGSPLTDDGTGTPQQKRITPNDGFVLERQQNNKLEGESGKAVKTDPAPPLRCD